MTRGIVQQTVLRLIITGLFFVSAPLFAQDENTQTPPPQQGGRRGQLMQKIEEAKHKKLVETLSLDDETAKKFFEVYSPAEKEIAGLVKERNQEEQKLLQITKGDYKDGDVDPTIEKIRSFNDQISQRALKLNDSLKPILNPRQRAKLLVFEHEFNRRARERVQQWRQNHPGRALRPKANGGAPGAH